MLALFDFFTRRTKLVNMLTIGILIIGLIAVMKIKREAFPRVDFDVVLVLTVYPGAAPEDVELNVTIPLEDQLRAVSGIEEITSVSQEGYSSIQVTLEPDARDKTGIKNEIQKAVDQVSDLPPEVENRPVVWELKTDNFEVIRVAMSSDSLNENQLRQRGRALKRKIEQLDYVATTETLGFRQREIQILVDLEALPKNYLSLNEIVNLIRARNVRIPAGVVRNQGEANSVVTEAKFQTLQEVENMILRTNFEGQQIRIKDVAKVQDGFEDYNNLIKMNGYIGVTINVLKKNKADQLRTVDQVKETVEAFKQEAGDQLRIEYVNDFSKSTRSILGIVTTNALLGMILVVATLLVFLNFRTALWTAMGIPLALFIALYVMVLTDVSLNSNSLIGMIIVLGMLVDDAIVVAESIYRYRLQGLSGLEAARRGLRDVALPIFITILTTIIAFAPLYFLPGIAGKFVLPIPLVITFTLLASLFEAYLILPNHLTAHSLKVSDDRASKALQEKAWFKRLQTGYVTLLRFALHHRLILIVLFVVMFISTLAIAFGNLKFVMSPQATLETGTFFIEAKRETSLIKMNEHLEKIEAILKSEPDEAIDSFTTQIAQGKWDVPETENYATLTINFPPAAQQTHDPEKIVDKIVAALKANPDIVKHRFERSQTGPPVGGDVELNIIGNDNAKRREIVDQIRAFLNELPGIENIESSDKPGKPEIALQFDFEKLARFGLSASDVGLAVRTALEGTVVSRTYTPEERIDYRVLLQKMDREKLSTIKKLYVTNAQRNLVPITNVVTLQEKATIAKIDHFNGDRVTKISLILDKQTITPIEVTGKLKTFLPGLLENYPLFRYELGGEAKASQDFIFNISIAFVVAVLSIYFILSLLFNSFIQPFIVMVTIPFAIVGVIWTLLLHGDPFSFLTLIGAVGLSGIVVNDSLIMVDYINRLIKEKGCGSIEDYLQAIVAGAKTRLRPIILTTITTAAGVMPTAYGLGGYVEAIAPMVLVIGWGILFSSALTLFLVPGLYLLEVEMEHRLATWFPWLPLKTQCEMPMNSVTLGNKPKKN